MSETQLTRRDLLRRGVTASLGAAIVSASSSSQIGLNASTGLSGLALEYENYDGLGLADLIAKKKISPLELLNAVRQRVELFNPKLNALCHLFFDKAELQINADLSVYLTGTITSAGSRVWKNNVAEFDSTLVSRYKQAGLVIFGKSNSPELRLTTTTESVLFGQTCNPWDLGRTAGGSSGGSAALVASR